MLLFDVVADVDIGTIVEFGEPFECDGDGVGKKFTPLLLLLLKQDC